MRILLDIDGVMVPAKGWKQPELLPDGFPAFSTKAVAALSELIGPDHTIVLTTSHKGRFSIEKWMHIFMQRGLSVKRLECLPEQSTGRKRKDEILEWFQQNQQNDAFVIIDDDKSLHDLPTSLKERWIETSPYIGLTPELVQGIIKS